jgi:hypothetical protein
MKPTQLALLLFACFFAAEVLAQPYVVIEVSGELDRIDGRVPDGLEVGMPYTAVVQYDIALAGDDVQPGIESFESLFPAGGVKIEAMAAGRVWSLPGDDPSPELSRVWHRVPSNTLSPDLYVVSVWADASDAVFPGTLGSREVMQLEVDGTRDGGVVWADRTAPRTEHVSDPSQIRFDDPLTELQFAWFSDPLPGEIPWIVQDYDPQVTLRLEFAPVRSEERTWSSLKAEVGGQ